jgi:hypothetical protein
MAQVIIKMQNYFLAMLEENSLYNLRVFVSP